MPTGLLLPSGSTHLRYFITHQQDRSTSMQMFIVWLTELVIRNVIMSLFLLHCRAILRMLEGLQSQDAAVRHFVRSWVRHVVASKEDMAKLLQPLVRILSEAEALRQSEPNKCPFSPYEVRLTMEEAAKDPAYAKYYYASLGISDPEEASKKNQYKEGLLYYIQVFDISQVLYSLSLLLSTVSVDPTAIVSCMSGIVVDSLSYMNTAPSSSAHSSVTVNTDSNTLNKDSDTPHDESAQLFPGSSQKSVLELLLTTCIQFLRSELHQSLEASLEDHLDNTRVKILCAEFLEVIHTEFVCILAKAHSTSDNQVVTSPTELEALPNRGANVANASYVTALITLCDVQKRTLILLARIVQEMRELERDRLRVDPSRSKLLHVTGPSRSDQSSAGLWKQLLTQQRQSRGQSSQTSDPATALGSLFVHLLKLVQSLITLDSQCQVCTEFSSSKSATTPLSLPTLTSVTAGIILSDGSELPPVLSGITTASQPLFQTLLLDILADVSLSHLHKLVLAMFIAIMPNLLGHQIDELAPKILKQLCKNLEQPRNTEKLQDHRANQKGKLSSKEKGILKQDTVSYLEAAISLILWCLFGEKNGGFSLPNESTLHADSSHQFIDLFWRVTSIAEKEEINLDLTPTLKQTSTIAWLLGVFSQKGGVTETGGGERDGGRTLPNGLVGASSTGLTSLVGQYIIMLLPAVYNVLTDLWRISSSINSSTFGAAETLGGMSLTSTSSTEATVYSFERVAVRRNRIDCGVSGHIFFYLLLNL